MAGFSRLQKVIGKMDALGRLGLAADATVSHMMANTGLSTVARGAALGVGYQVARNVAQGRSVTDVSPVSAVAGGLAGIAGWRTLKNFNRLGGLSKEISKLGSLKATRGLAADLRSSGIGAAYTRYTKGNWGAASALSRLTGGGGLRGMAKGLTGNMTYGKAALLGMGYNTARNVYNGDDAVSFGSLAGGAIKGAMAFGGYRAFKNWKTLSPKLKSLADDAWKAGRTNKWEDVWTSAKKTAPDLWNALNS
jgi:hypothetical protein